MTFEQPAVAIIADFANLLNEGNLEAASEFFHDTFEVTNDFLYRFVVWHYLFFWSFFSNTAPIICVVIIFLFRPSVLPLELELEVIVEVEEVTVEVLTIEVVEFSL